MDHIGLSYPQVITDEERQERHQKIANVENVWKFAPRSQRAEFEIRCLIRYEDILVVDTEGDSLYKFPHVYVDFRGIDNPFRGSYGLLRYYEREFHIDEEWQRVSKFPKQWNELVRPRLHRNRKVELDPETLKRFRDYDDDADILFAIDDRYGFLNPRDYVKVEGRPDEAYLLVTFVCRTAFGDYVDKSYRSYRLRSFAERQVGRKLADDDVVTVVEVERGFPRNVEVDDV